MNHTYRPSLTVAAIQAMAAIGVDDREIAKSWDIREGRRSRYQRSAIRSQQATRREARRVHPHGF